MSKGSQSKGNWPLIACLIAVNAFTVGSSLWAYSQGLPAGMMLLVASVTCLTLNPVMLLTWRVVRRNRRPEQDH
jgi:hypothetical protein